MEAFRSVPDKYGATTGFRDIPPSVTTLVLAAGVAETITVPTGAQRAVFSFTGNIFVKKGVSVDIPTVSTTDGTGAEINPNAYIVSGGDQISIISPDAVLVSVAFYG